MENRLVKRRILTLEQAIEKAPDAIKDYDKDKDALLRPAVSEETSDRKFEFNELHALSKELMPLQRQIEYRIGVSSEMTAGRVLYTIRSFVDRARGRECSDVGELIKTEADIFKKGAEISLGLIGATRQEASQVMAFMMDNEATIAQVKRERPGHVAEFRDKASAYQEAERLMSEVDKSDPRYNILRAIARQSRDLSFESYAEIDHGYFVENKLESHILDVENTHALMKYSGVLARRMYVCYHVGNDLLVRVAPATLLARELFGKPGLLYEVVSGIRTAIDHAQSVQLDFENRALVKKICQGIGTTPGNGQTYQLLDDIRGGLTSAGYSPAQLKKGYGGR